jgi:hypothetical protein
MALATFRGIFSQTQLVTLLLGNVEKVAQKVKLLHTVIKNCT